MSPVISVSSETSFILVHLDRVSFYSLILFIGWCVIFFFSVLFCGLLFYRCVQSHGLITTHVAVQLLRGSPTAMGI